MATELTQDLLGYFKTCLEIGLKLGNDINGKASEDYFGISTDLSKDGSIVAIGSINNDDNGINSGQVRIFQNIPGNWKTLAAVIQSQR